MGLRSGFITPDSQVALLGIGSGINSLMMMTHWRQPLVAGDLDANAQQHLADSVHAKRELTLGS
jgi:hypothetical protein